MGFGIRPHKTIPGAGDRQESLCEFQQVHLFFKRTELQVTYQTIQQPTVKLIYLCLIEGLRCLRINPKKCIRYYHCNDISTSTPGEYLATGTPTAIVGDLCWVQVQPIGTSHQLWLVGETKTKPCNQLQAAGGPSDICFQ